MCEETNQELGRSYWFLKNRRKRRKQAKGTGLKETAKWKRGSGKAGDLNRAEAAEEGEEVG